MLDFFQKLFETDGFPPRWYCGVWPESLGWLHVFSDVAIFIAYTTIPLVLIFFIVKRDDLPFLPIFFLFGAFIFCCGFGHLIEASMFWYPWYRLSGLIKLCTAIVSILTAVSLFKIIPQVMRIPETRKKFEGYILANPSAIITFNRSGKIEYFNPGFSELFNYSREEIKTLSIFDFFESFEKQILKQNINLLFNKKKRKKNKITFHISGKKRGGANFPINLSMNLIANDQYQMVICSIEDLTLQKNLEKEKNNYLITVEKSNQELEEFARAIAHDLKEPIRGIKNYAARLQKSTTLDTVNSERIQSIVKLTERMYQMITDLLDYSLLGKETEPNKLIKLDSVLKSVLETLKATIEDKNAKIIFNNQLPALVYSEAKLSQIFYNLISNGLKYNKSEKPIIEIGYKSTIAHKSKIHTFYVKDNGVGIDEKYYESIFKIFRKLHANSKFGSGTGVGLSLTKKIIENYGGNIWVESEAGKGSTFFFTIIEKANTEKRRA